MAEGQSERTPDSVRTKREPEWAEATVAPLPSDEIGRYRVLELLGQGGMGSVYLCHDVDLDRKVAVKLLLGSERDADGRGRLLREAQAMAKLHHPNVVSVYEVGIHEERMFVAMELVDGPTLNEWLAEQPRPWREIVEAFGQAGRGLAAAHDAGIVHRDFKPQNVMVRASGRVQVLDFGLAREVLSPADTMDGAPDDDAPPSPSLLTTPLTEAGVVVGTPAYMSPEQFARAEPTASADQFAFCVSLYEALYGQRPFQGKTYEALEQAIRSGVIAKPDARMNVPTRVGRILQRGLRAKPEDRWPSMEALLTELERDPAAPWRRGITMVGGAVLLSGASLGAFSLWVADRGPCETAPNQLDAVWNEDRKHAVERSLLATEQPYAADTWAQIEPRLDSYATTWVALVTEACEIGGDELEVQLACFELRRRQLAVLTDLFARATADVARNAAEVVTELPDLERCRDSALEVGSTDAGGSSVEAAELRGRLVEVGTLWDTTQSPQAIGLVDAIVADARVLDEKLVLARALLERGRFYGGAGRSNDATISYEEAAAVAEAVGGDAMVARAFAYLTHVAGSRDVNEAKAQRYAKRAWEALERSGGDERIEAHLLNSLGVVSAVQGRYSEAVDHWSRTLEIRERQHGSNSITVAKVLENLGIVYRNLGQLDHAVSNIERGLSIHEAILGPSHPALVNSLHNRGDTLRELGRYDDALESYRRGLTIMRGTAGEDHPKLGMAINNMGMVYGRQGDRDREMDAYRRALAHFDRTQPGHPDMAYPLGNLGLVHHNLGEYEIAVLYCRRALVVLERSFALNHPRRLYRLGQMAESLLELGRAEAAVAALEEALALMADDAAPWTRAFIESTLAEALVAADRERGRALDLARGAHARLVEAGQGEKLQKSIEAWLDSVED